MHYNLDDLKYGQHQKPEEFDETKFDAELSNRTSPYVLIVGPSGVGKGTIIDAIVESHTINAKQIKRHTTKEVIQNELRFYNFVKKKKFQEMILHTEFVEWGLYGPGFYSTSANDINKALTYNGPVILDSDLDSTLIIKKIFDRLKIPYIDILIVPDAPHFLEIEGGIKHYTEILVKRIKKRKRGVGNDEIRGRMGRAKELLYLEDQMQLAVTEVIDLVKQTHSVGVQSSHNLF